MAVYITMIAWCLFWGYLLDHKVIYRNTLDKVIFQMMPFLAVFIVSAIRYDVGDDYSGTYTNIYLRLLNGDIDERVEPFIMLLYKAMALVDANLQWYFIITSFIICILVDKSIKQQSEDKQLSYFIFICGTFLFFSYNGIRQSIGMALFYYSLFFLFSNRRNNYNIKDSAKYFFTNSVGVMNHMSSALFLPLFFLLKKKIPIKIKFTILMSLFISSTYLVPYIMGLLAQTKFVLYVGNGAYIAENKWNASMFFNLFILILYEIVLYKNKACKEKDIVYDNIHFYGVVVSMFTTCIPLVLRLFVSFRYIEYLSIPNLIMHANRKYRIMIIIMVYALYFAYFVYMVGVLHGNKALPYQTFFQ